MVDKLRELGLERQRRLAAMNNQGEGDKDNTDAGVSASAAVDMQIDEEKKDEGDSEMRDESGDHDQQPGKAD